MASTLIEIDRETGVETRRPLRESTQQQERRALERLRRRRKGRRPPDAGCGIGAWFHKHPWSEGPDR